MVGYRMAVPLFFILSGRIIACSIIRKKSLDSVYSVAMRRPFRLMVPVFCMYLFHWILCSYRFYDGIVDSKLFQGENNIFHYENYNHQHDVWSLWECVYGTFYTVWYMFLITVPLLTFRHKVGYGSYWSHLDLVSRVMQFVYHLFSSSTNVSIHKKVHLIPYSNPVSVMEKHLGRTTILTI